MEIEEFIDSVSATSPDLPEARLLIAVISEAIKDNDREFLNEKCKELELYLDLLRLNKDTFFSVLRDKNAINT